MNNLEQLHLDAIQHSFEYRQFEKVKSFEINQSKAASKSAQITENISIEFAEWVSKYDWVFVFDKNYWVNDDISKKPESTKNLFDEFLKQRQ